MKDLKLMKEIILGFANNVKINKRSVNLIKQTLLYVVIEKMTNAHLGQSNRLKCYTTVKKLFITIMH